MTSPEDPNAPPDRPWSALAADLIAFAKAPEALDRRIALALRWVNLALAQPQIAEGENPRPLGYAQRPDGALQDALLAERAIAALTELIDAGLDSLPTVLEARGEILYGWSQFHDAANDLSAAAAACPATAEGETWRVGLEERAAAMRKAAPGPIANKERIELVRLAKRLADYPVRVFEPRAPKLTFFDIDDIDIDVPLEPRVLVIDAEARAMGLRPPGLVRGLEHRATPTASAPSRARGPTRRAPWCSPRQRPGRSRRRPRRRSSPTAVLWRRSTARAGSSSRAVRRSTP